MKNLLLGVAAGDIAGMPYEFENRAKNYSAVDLLPSSSTYTDDTVCTLTYAEAFIKNLNMAENLWKRCRVDFYRGFGGRFARQLIAKDIQPPYNSFGNGSAMGVSSAGFMAKDVEECIEPVTQTVMFTHNHPEEIKGAVATALAMFYGVQGQSKDSIREHIFEKYYPNWSDLTYQGIKPNCDFDETRQQTVPAALIRFLESTNYADCLKLAIALDSDADTLAAISGPMAYAFYKTIPKELVGNAIAKLPEWMLQVDKQFDEFVNK